MFDVEVIADHAAATVALEPVRSRILSELGEPASASTLAGRLGIPRQKINYHLKTLEAHGLVLEETTRRWGGLTERLMVATASSYVVSPNALGPVGADPGRTADHLSAGYVIALAARIVREVGGLVRRAAEEEKRLATLSIDAEISFKSPTDRAAFSNELADIVTRLVAKYHDETSPDSRPHRLVVVAHPLPTEPLKEKECQ